MSRRSVRAVLLAALASAALATADCSGTSGGDAAGDPPIVDSPGLGGLPETDPSTPPAPPAPTGPPASAEGSDQYLAAVDAGALAGENGDVYAVAEGPGGTLVALAGDWLARPRPAVLAEYAVAGGQAQLLRSVEIPAVEPTSRLHVTPDGTVLVLTEADDGSAQLVRLAPGAAQAEVLPVSTGARDSYGAPAPVEGTALTADGRTLLLTVNHYATAVPQPRLVAVDVATGAVTSDRELAVDTPEYPVVTEVAARADGGVAVLLFVALDGDGDVGDPVLVEYDAALEPVGDPVRLSSTADAFATDLRLLDDGGALVAVDGGSFGGPGMELVVVRDGAVERTAVLDPLGADQGPEVVAVGPDGRTAAFPFTGPDGRTTLATVDLGSGEVIAQVPLCDGEGAGDQAVPVAGGVAAVVQCRGLADQRLHVALVG